MVGKCLVYGYVNIDRSIINSMVGITHMSYTYHILDTKYFFFGIFF